MGIFRKLIALAAPTSGAGETPASSAPTARRSGAMLQPGRHIIDGRAVDVAPDPRPLVLYPLKPGRHVIDDRVVIVEYIHQRMPVE
ncbi:MAG: hypothetical protein ACYCUE_01185 [Steroidobacteraceae bacterium]